MNKIKRKIYINKIIEVMKNDYPLIKNLKLYGFYEQLSVDELNYVLSGIFGKPVRVGGLEIYDEDGNIIYYENSEGYWRKYEYDENGRYRIYYEDSYGNQSKSEYDDNRNNIYFEDSNGYWEKREYDENGNMIYSEYSNGQIIDNR